MAHQSVICPKCSEELDIPVELVGGPVRCASCSHIFTADLSNFPKDANGGVILARASITIPADRPRRERDEPDDGDNDRLQDDDDQPRPRPRTRRPRQPERPASSGGAKIVIWLFLAGSLGACCLGCGGVGFWMVRIIDPKMTAYTAPDGTFTAAFPHAVKVSTSTDAKNRTVTTHESVQVVLGQQWVEYSISHYDLKTKPSSDSERDEALEEAAAELTKQVGILSDKTTKTNHKGFSALEIDVQIDDEVRDYGRVVLVGKRVYIVRIKGRGLSDEAPTIRKFWDKFIPTDTKPTELPKPTPKKGIEKGKPKAADPDDE
ncbi:MAG: hypothetical protein ACRC8S_10530 [Fimbriiglobus sp.]